MAMRIFVGLGNPGEQYARHRHNVGFMAVDAIADAHGFAAPRARFQGSVREGFLQTPQGREKTLILKPATYMNESGRSVREAAQFYKVDPENIFVFYDELDLAPGKLKAKIGGGHAGHNGIRSIDSHLGNNFVRIRIGIGHPGDKSKVSAYVLGNFSKADQDWLPDLLDAIAQAAPKLFDAPAKFLSDAALRLAPPEKRGSSDAPSKDTTRATASTKESKKRGPLADALQHLLPKKDDH